MSSGEDHSKSQGLFERSVGTGAPRSNTVLCCDKLVSGTTTRLKARVKAQELEIAALREQVRSMWYAPGMPGFELARAGSAFSSNRLGRVDCVPVRVDCVPVRVDCVESE